jgi:hypothetical protein
VEYQKIHIKLCVFIDIYNSSTRKVGEKESQPGLHSETLSQISLLQKKKVHTTLQCFLVFFFFFFFFLIKFNIH